VDGTVEAGVGADDGPAGVDDTESEKEVRHKDLDCVRVEAHL